MIESAITTVIFIVWEYNCAYEYLYFVRSVLNAQRSRGDRATSPVDCETLGGDCIRDSSKIHFGIRTESIFGLESG